MTDFNLLIRLRAIDYNRNNKIDGPKEGEKAKELGVNAQDGKSINQIIQDSSKINLQDALKEIDRTQTVDNQHNDLRRKRFTAIG